MSKIKLSITFLIPVLIILIYSISNGQISEEDIKYKDDFSDSEYNTCERMLSKSGKKGMTGNAFNNYGFRFYKAKNYKKALKLFRCSVMLDPKSIMGHYNRASTLALLYGQGKSVNLKVIEYSLIKTLELYPGRIFKIKSDTDLNSIRNTDMYQNIINEYDLVNNHLSGGWKKGDEVFILNSDGLLLKTNGRDYYKQGRWHYEYRWKRLVLNIKDEDKIYYTVSDIKYSKMLLKLHRKVQNFKRLSYYEKERQRIKIEKYLSIEKGITTFELNTGYFINNSEASLLKKPSAKSEQSAFLKKNYFVILLSRGKTDYVERVGTNYWYEAKVGPSQGWVFGGYIGNIVKGFKGLEKLKLTVKVKYYEKEGRAHYLAKINNPNDFDVEIPDCSLQHRYKFKNGSGNRPVLDIKRQIIRANGEIILLNNFIIKSRTQSGYCHAVKDKKNYPVCVFGVFKKEQDCCDVKPFVSYDNIYNYGLKTDPFRLDLPIYSK